VREHFVPLLRRRPQVLATVRLVLLAGEGRALQSRRRGWASLPAAADFAEHDHRRLSAPRSTHKMLPRAGEASQDNKHIMRSLSRRDEPRFDFDLSNERTMG